MAKKSGGRNLSKAQRRKMQVAQPRPLEPVATAPAREAAPTVPPAPQPPRPTTTYTYARAAAAAARRSYTPTPAAAPIDYSYVKSDLRRIALLVVTILVVLGVLTVFLR